MSLVEIFEDMFPAGIRNRGEDYADEGRVVLAENNASRVVAYVEGSSETPYRVTLTNSFNEVSTYCDCPYFETEGLCKHVWAVMLQADVKGAFPALRKSSTSSSSRTKSRRADEKWRGHLAELQKGSKAAMSRWKSDEELVYLLDIDSEDSTSREGDVVDHVHLECGVRRKKRNGEWSVPKPRSVSAEESLSVRHEIDRTVLGMILELREDYEEDSEVYLGEHTEQVLLPLVIKTGRCFLRELLDDDVDGERETSARSEPTLLVWDGDIPWRFVVVVEENRSHYTVRGELRRNGNTIDVTAPQAITAGGFVFHQNTVGVLEELSRNWLSFLRREQKLQVPKQGKPELIGALYSRREGITIEVPESLRIEEAHAAPTPWVHIFSPKNNVRNSRQNAWLEAELFYDYGGIRVRIEDSASGVLVPDAMKWMVRDTDQEKDALSVMHELGFREKQRWDHERELYHSVFEVRAPRLSEVTQRFLKEGWRVEADGKVYRQARAFDIQVRSGIDWFELRGALAFGETSVSLPELLRAWKRGEEVVLLDDGSLGLLPEEWLKKHGQLVDFGKLEDDHLRFRHHHVGALDALILATPEATSDHVFERIRNDILDFRGIKAKEPSKGFVGSLREYQREGLGWFEFLRTLSAGGCLADDMGLGKTIQVLALLLERSEEPNRRPSLVVVPRSLVFNWKEEAARFAPSLRVYDHSVKDRSQTSFEECDVVLTTYGILRRDVAPLREIEFDYIVLDEANAIKNERSESAKAARLLSGRHRLALTGTPVENHLGELWSLFEFLNPGLLGSGAFLKVVGKDPRAPGDDTRQLLSRLLRPFILRRTKEQVARELPPKHEQIVYCDLEQNERTRYDELRNYYRSLIDARVEADGLSRSKMHVLEALLRLRQASCHAGLLDAKRVDEPSAKLDVLIPMISDIVEEGHKIIVFSQFTSFLKIVRKRLDEQTISYEYLDGKTRKREDVVARFQEDSECAVLLVSLKAGGVGLNLTAAEYVFLLDPWWNPAVETQAMDRAHRIGQTRPVFVYRFVARNTIEDKVLELQASKRSLVEDLLSADNALIRNLTREDLQVLLS